MDFLPGGAATRRRSHSAVGARNESGAAAGGQNKTRAAGSCGGTGEGLDHYPAARSRTIHAPAALCAFSTQKARCRPAAAIPRRHARRCAKARAAVGDWLRRQAAPKRPRVSPIPTLFSRGSKHWPRFATPVTPTACTAPARPTRGRSWPCSRRLSRPRSMPASPASSTSRELLVGAAEKSSAPSPTSSCPTLLPPPAAAPPPRPQRASQRSHGLCWRTRPPAS